MAREYVSLRSLVVYEVFVRNHVSGGTFSAVEADLERIKSLGADIVWLMPIHPIGKVSRKGSLGSPYSIADYRGVNPELGSEGELQSLISKAHRVGLRIMIDVVYNHTSHDSLLVAEHPNWFHQDSLGKPVTTVPEWSDVIDLKYPNDELERYLIESLLGWSRLGIDGFRCDVASLVPVDFWIRARAAVARERPGTLWLAESVHAAFIDYRRSSGLRAHSDAELYSAFDLEYDYDLYPIWQAAVTGRVPASRYLEMVRMQRSLYPAGAVKMRCVENHDQRRIASLAKTPDQARAWTAFEAFNEGAFLIYAGQESGTVRSPSLFDPDPIDWNGYGLQDFLSRLAKLKKAPELSRGRFVISTVQPAVVGSWHTEGRGLLGVFNVEGAAGPVEVGLPDGDYLDLLSDREVRVTGGATEIPASACIIRAERMPDREWFPTDLLDFGVPANEVG